MEIHCCKVLILCMKLYIIIRMQKLKICIADFRATIKKTQKRGLANKPTMEIKWNKQKYSINTIIAGKEEKRNKNQVNKRKTNNQRVNLNPTQSTTT